MKKTNSVIVPILLAVFAVAVVLSLVLPHRGEISSAAAPAEQRRGAVSRVSLLRRPAAVPVPARDAVPADAKEAAPFERQRYADGDPFYATLRNTLKFSARVRTALEAPQAKWAAEGRRLLASKVAEDRALGGVLLLYAEKLDEETIHALVNDRELFVPLTVFDWVRDFGTDEEIENFSHGVGTREVSTEALAGFLANSAKYPGGGRSALELFLSRHDEETVFDGTMKFLSSPDVSYDVFEQAALKIFEPENRESALSFVDELEKKDAKDGEGLKIQLLWKLRRATEQVLEDDDDEVVPYKVWDTSLSQLEGVEVSDMGLVVRDVANYLEYGLRRDDPDFEPVVEEGTWELANSFLERVRAAGATLTEEETEALGRLEAYVERIREYDPAFAPDDEEDDDEEVDEETLNAQDMEEAEFLEADDDEEDDDDDDDEDDSDDDEDDDEDDENDEDDSDDAADEEDDEDDDDAADEEEDDDDSDEDEEDDEDDDDTDDDSDDDADAGEEDSGSDGAAAASDTAAGKK